MPKPNRQLAAKNHAMQTESLRRIAGIEAAVEREIRRTVGQIAGDLAAQSHGQELDRLRIRKQLGMLSERIAKLVDESLKRLALWSHEASADNLVETLPPEYLPLLAIGVQEATGFNPLPGFGAGGFIPPVVTVGSPAPGGEGPRRFTLKKREIELLQQAEIDEEEARELAKKLIFPPPSQATVQGVLDRRDNRDGKTYEERLKGLSRVVKDWDAASHALAYGYSQGENIAELTKRMLPLVDGMQASAKRIARTEGMRVATAMQRESMASAEHLIAGQQYMATLDQYSRPEHASLNGQIFWKPETGKTPTLDEMPDLEAGRLPNCRCASTPVLYEPEELAGLQSVQDAITRPTGPAAETYGEWFGQQDRRTQASVVGVQRYTVARKAIGRDPDFLHFLDPDKLDEPNPYLSVDRIRDESTDERRQRREVLRSRFEDRRRQLRRVANVGFVPGVR